MASMVDLSLPPLIRSTATGAPRRVSMVEMLGLSVVRRGVISSQPLLSVSVHHGQGKQPDLAHEIPLNRLMFRIFPANT